MKNKYFIILITLLSLVSCTEVIAPDISTKEVILVAPTDSLYSCNELQTLWWSPVDFAESYNLQIVSPGFQYIEQIILDTVVTENKFELSLVPGTYQWRVAALNNSYETSFSTRTLTIKDLNGFSSLSMYDVKPLDSSSTNRPVQTFSWKADNRVEQYHFNLYYKGKIVIDKTLSENTTTEDLTWGDGEYSWTIQGFSCDSSTRLNTNMLYLDATPPEVPVLVAPDNLSELSDSVVMFQWLKKELNTTDSLFVYSDSTLTKLILSKRTTETFEQDTLHTNNEYYWRVRSIDTVGNLSNYSPTWRFKILPLKNE